MKHLSVLFLTLMPFLGLSQTTYKVDQQRIFSWDAAISDWKLDSTSDFTYGNEGTKETNRHTTTDEGQSQSNKTYNANNDITKDVVQNWDPMTMTWKNTFQTIYDYDGNNLIRQTNQFFIQGKELNSSRILYDYDASNKLMYQTMQSYTSDWMYTSRTEYEYSGDYLVRTTSLAYDNATMDFVPNASGVQTLYEYNGSKVTKTTTQRWLPGMGWDDVDITETTYDADRTVVQIDSTLNEMTSMWEITRDTFIYKMDLLDMVERESYNGSGWDKVGKWFYDYDSELVTTLTWKDWDGANYVYNNRILSQYYSNGNRNVTILENWDIATMMWCQVLRKNSIFPRRLHLA